MANKANILDKVIHVGDIVRVHHKFQDKNKERTQIFSGVVIRIKGSGVNKSFTVRKIASAGIGVERIWPVNAPFLQKIEVVKRGRVKRAKLYYLRGKVGKKATRVKLIKNKKEIKKQLITNEEKKPRKSGRKSSPAVSSK